MPVRRSTPILLAALVIAVPGCTTTGGDPTAGGTSTAATTSAPASQTGTAPASPDTTPTTTAPTTTAPTTTAPTTTAPTTPTGPPIGTATMAVRGEDAKATIRYSINGGPEQTETDVQLPWEKQFPVYPEIPTELSADSGDTVLSCTIIMGSNLVAYVTEARPTCNFAYYE